jgi:mono/diheme cytochrome c family protein
MTCAAAFALAGLGVTEESSSDRPVPNAAPPIRGDHVAGETSFAQQCARCHQNAAALAAVVPGADAEAKAAFLGNFLAHHFAPEPQERADIVAYLLHDELGSDFDVQMILDMGEAGRGALAYATDCIGCHAVPARVIRRVPGDTEEARIGWLWAFLEGHHAPDQRRRANIIVHLTKLSP